jgi:hypothetical protein
MFVRHLARVAGSKPALPLVAITFVATSAVTVAIVFAWTPRSEPPGSTSAVQSATSASEPARADEAEAFATQVASDLFAWDTTSGTPHSDYIGRILALAEPTGEESAGLVTDLSTYLPSPESWEDLKTYETRQWIDITSYEVPDEWKSAEFNGETADLADGTTAITVTGLRRRSGIWQGKPAQTVDEVSFTIFMTCRPTYDTCKLLRLSQLNKPLH